LSSSPYFFVADAFEAESYWGPLNSDTRTIYRDMSLESLGAEFRSKELYLIHGTMDTTVPLEQTMLFSKHLIAHHAYFHQQVTASIMLKFDLEKNVKKI
jgi:dipeptidyl aminopeptidase/acylaminoacyl peptidase